MSVINCFAAVKAGIPLGAFATCGDDLIAEATQEEAKVYTRILSLFGMVVNQTKSFFGSRGVFCEKFGKLQVSSNTSCQTRNTKLNASFRNIEKISEASAAKYR